MYLLQELILISYKWLLSFTKKDWQLDDYPVRVSRNDVADPATSWAAQILNWPGPIGLGSTPLEAKVSLKECFANISEDRRNSGEGMPRPGAHVPIRFSPVVRVMAYPELYDEFIEHILEYPPGMPLFISDLSSLYDFEPSQEGVESLHGRIRSRFDVETADIPDANIAAILERIAAKRAAHED